MLESKEPMHQLNIKDILKKKQDGVPILPDEKEEKKKESESSPRVLLEGKAGRPGLNDTEEVEVYKLNGKWHLETEESSRELDPQEDEDNELIERAKRRLGWV